MAQLFVPGNQGTPTTLPGNVQNGPNRVLIEISDSSDGSSPPQHAARPTNPNLRHQPGPPNHSRAPRENMVDLQSSDSDDSDLPGLHPRKRPKLGNPPGLQVGARTDQPSLPLAFGTDPGHLQLAVRRSQNGRMSQPPNSQTFDLPHTRSFRSTVQLPPHDSFEPPLPPPYYYDTKLNIEMYRGPGFEKFPVVLGSVEGHREEVERWKGKGNALGFAVGDIIATPVPAADVYEARCIHRVTEVFPDVQTAFVLEKIRHPNTHADLVDADFNEDTLPNYVINQLLEMDSYPRAKTSGRIEEQRSAVHEETGATVPYDKGLLKDAAYAKEAVRILATEFTHVPTHYINKVVDKGKPLFDCYLDLRQMEDDYYKSPKRPYVRTRQPRSNLEKKYSRPDFEVRDEVKFTQMVNEFQAAKQHIVRQELKRVRKKENDEAEALNLARHVASGSLVECQCCFDEEIPLNRSVNCISEDQAHLFCFACVAQLADTQVGMMRYEMLCMDGSGCKAELSPEAVARAVSLRTFDKLALNQQQAEIAAAGIEGLEQCPYCDFKAICSPVEEDSVFNCMNPDCGRSTCRRCKEECHIPQSCAEAKKDKGLSARHQIEEARTASILRICPKCSVPIIKELGCNKMVCTKCRCLMCYVCKKDITGGKDGGYEHFNKPGSKCKLHDEHGVDRHEVEADEAEKEAIKKAKAEDADLDESHLYIDTGPGQKKPKKANPAPQLGIPPFPLGGLGGHDAQAHLQHMRQMMHQHRVIMDQQAHLHANLQARAQALDQAQMQQAQARAQELATAVQPFNAAPLPQVNPRAAQLVNAVAPPMVNPNPNYMPAAVAQQRQQQPMNAFRVIGPYRPQQPNNIRARDAMFGGATAHPNLGAQPQAFDQPAPGRNVEEWLWHEDNDFPDIDPEDMALFFGEPAGGEIPFQQGAWRF
jgi:hypothetical protein